MSEETFSSQLRHVSKARDFLSRIEVGIGAGEMKTGAESWPVLMWACPSGVAPTEGFQCVHNRRSCSTSHYFSGSFRKNIKNRQMKVLVV